MIRCRHISAVARNLVGDAHIGGIVITARDVEARKAFEEQLRHRAFHDELTGLANRALFFDRVDHAVLQAARADSQAAVLFIDLDDFKLVNDRLGHAAGDAVLQEVARRLGACTRSGDTVARLGGDEFGVLLEGVVGPIVLEAGERALAALEAPIDAEGEAVTISASVGMALSTADSDVEDLLRRGDLAMYAAKRNGKRRLALYTPDIADAGSPGTGPPTGSPAARSSAPRSSRSCRIPERSKWSSSPSSTSAPVVSPATRRCRASTARPISHRSVVRQGTPVRPRLRP